MLERRTGDLIVVFVNSTGRMDPKMANGEANALSRLLYHQRLCFRLRVELWTWLQLQGRRWIVQDGIMSICTAKNVMSLHSTDRPQMLCPECQALCLHKVHPQVYQLVCSY